MITDAGIRRRVLDKDAAIHLARHSAQVIQVLGVHHRRVPKTALGQQGKIDPLVSALYPHQRNDRHQLL